MNLPNNTSGEMDERRKHHSDRREAERRLETERRYDSRGNGRKHNRSFYGWIRSLVILRLGIDRRKNNNQRNSFTDRRCPSSILTKDELADLLK